MIIMEPEKERDPIMEKATKSDEDPNINLKHKFKNLEQQWEDYIKNSSRPTRRVQRRRSLTDTRNSNTNLIKSLDSLLNNSPSPLTSPIQRGEWKVRTNNMAVEEILRERKAAIASGKLKGRRLFNDDNLFEFGETHENSGFDERSMLSYESDINDSEREKHEDGHEKSKQVLVVHVCRCGCDCCCCDPNLSCLSSSSSLRDDCMRRESLIVMEEKAAAAAMAESDKVLKNKDVNVVVGGNGKRSSRLGSMGLFAIGLILSVIGFICFVRFGSKDNYQNEVILVPT